MAMKNKKPAAFLYISHRAADLLFSEYALFLSVFQALVFNPHQKLLGGRVSTP